MKACEKRLLKRKLIDCLRAMSGVRQLPEINKMSKSPWPKTMKCWVACQSEFHNLICE